MELTRDQQQYILDVLARLRGRQLGVTLKFTLKEPEQDEAINPSDSKLVAAT